MPYASHAQRRYFNANRAKLESQGVDVAEWNTSSKGKKMPEKKKAGILHAILAEKQANDSLAAAGVLGPDTWGDMFKRRRYEGQGSVLGALAGAGLAAGGRFGILRALRGRAIGPAIAKHMPRMAPFGAGAGLAGGFATGQGMADRAVTDDKVQRFADRIGASAALQARERLAAPKMAEVVAPPAIPAPSGEPAHVILDKDHKIPFGKGKKNPKYAGLLARLAAANAGR